MKSVYTTWSNRHTRKWGEKMFAITISFTYGDDNAHLEFIVLYSVVHMTSARNSCVKNEKRKLEREVQTPHSWPIMVWMPVLENGVGRRGFRSYSKDLTSISHGSTLTPYWIQMKAREKNSEWTFLIILFNSLPRANFQILSQNEKVFKLLCSSVILVLLLCEKKKVNLN